jgi:TonB family protein
MIAAALLLGGCASSPSTGRKGYAPQTGELATKWGKLPTYRHQSAELREFKQQFSWLPAFFAGIDHTAKVDVLVNRDGTVRDVAIIASSGDSGHDASVLGRLQGVRITMKIAPEDPAPYVYRTVVAFQKNRWDTTISASNFYPQTNYAEQPVSPPPSLLVGPGP